GEGGRVRDAEAQGEPGRAHDEGAPAAHVGHAEADAVVAGRAVRRGERMRSIRQQARFAGLLYIFMCVTGLPGLLFIPRALIVNGDALATADHLRAAPTLLRWGIASELFHQVVFAYLALALYDLFRPVDRNRALELLLLVVMSVPIMFLNTLNELGALILVGAPSFLAPFTRPQLDALAYLFLRLHEEGIGVVDVFWSLWLVPFGLLVLRSK